MAPSRSTPRMMQVTRAAFQAVASLNEQATDPKSHTPVKNVYTSGSLVPLPANSDGRPYSESRAPTNISPEPVVPGLHQRPVAGRVDNLLDYLIQAQQHCLANCEADRLRLTAYDARRWYAVGHCSSSAKVWAWAAAYLLHNNAILDHPSFAETPGADCRRRG